MANYLISYHLMQHGRDLHCAVYIVISSVTAFTQPNQPSSKVILWACPSSSPRKPDLTCQSVAAAPRQMIQTEHRHRFE